MKQRDLEPHEHFLYYQSLIFHYRTEDKSQNLHNAEATYRGLRHHFNKITSKINADHYSFLMIGIYENHLGLHEEAAEHLMQALKSCPYIFAIWEELGYALSHCHGEDLNTLMRLIPHYDSHGLGLYLVGTWGLDISSYERFENCSDQFITLQKALVHFNQHNYSSARILLESLPAEMSLMDGMATLSDILYLEGREDQLAALFSKYKQANDILIVCVDFLPRHMQTIQYVIISRVTFSHFGVIMRGLL